jgi:hypothetical protein
MYLNIDPKKFTAATVMASPARTTFLNVCFSFFGTHNITVCIFSVLAFQHKKELYHKNL